MEDTNENLTIWLRQNLTRTEIICDVMKEAMIAIRNITEGRLGWSEKSELDRLTAVNAISEVLHNLHPMTPHNVIITSLDRERDRAPEAFEMLRQLSGWLESVAPEKVSN